MGVVGGHLRLGRQLRVRSVSGMSINNNCVYKSSEGRDSTISYKAETLHQSTCSNKLGYNIVGIHHSHFSGTCI